eukprot:s502_g40.t1
MVAHPAQQQQAKLIKTGRRSWLLCTAPLKGQISYTRALAWSGDPHLQRDYSEVLAMAKAVEQVYGSLRVVIMICGDHVMITVILIGIAYVCFYRADGQFVIFWTGSSGGRDALFLHEVPAVQQGPLVANPADLGDEEDEEVHRASSMRPTSFLPNTQAQEDQDPDAEGQDEQEHGHDTASGQLASLQPWRAFFFNTVLLAVMWWCASFVAFYDVWIDLPEFTKARYGLKPGEVARMATLLGEKVETGWGNLTWQPHGFACDGSVFAVAGRDGLGRSAILQGEMKKGSALHFEPAPHCSSLAQIQDLAVRCHGQCDAVVMPLKGQELVSCPLLTKNWSSSGLARPLAVSWLEDRGGAPLEEHQGLKHLLHPEEMSAISTAPCPVLDGKPDEDCLVVGTTARRLVQLARGRQMQDSDDIWLPRRLLQRSGEEPLGPGAFAAFGKKFLGVLQKDANSIAVLDLSAGGRTVGQWSLPRPSEAKDDAGFSGLCASDDALFALQAGPAPSVWRFPHPLGRV